MRQLSPVTNLVLAVLAGLGLLASLGLPWYAAPATSSMTTDGPVERAAWQIGHFFQGDALGLVSGHEALGASQASVAVLVFAVALAAVGMAAAGTRRPAADLLRILAPLAPLMIAALGVSSAGRDAQGVVHFGFAVSVALSILLASAATHGARLRARRRPAAAVRVSGS